MKAHFGTDLPVGGHVVRLLLYISSTVSTSQTAGELHQGQLDGANAAQNRTTAKSAAKNQTTKKSHEHH